MRRSALMLAFGCATPALNDADDVPRSMHLAHHEPDEVGPALEVGPHATATLGAELNYESGHQAHSAPLDDLDADGFAVPLDCNDNDPAVNPDGAEVCDNQIDDDCDHGSGACARTGDLLVDGADHQIFGDLYEDQVGRYQSVLLVPDVDGDGFDELVIGAGGNDESDRTGGLFVYRGGGSSGTTLSDAHQVIPPTEHGEVGQVMSWGDFDQDGVAEVATMLGGGDDGSAYGTAFVEVDQWGETALSDVDTMISGDQPGEQELIVYGTAWVAPDGVTGSAFAVVMGTDNGLNSVGVHLFLPPVESSNVLDSDASILHGPDWNDVEVVLDVGDLDGDGYTSLGVSSELRIKTGVWTTGVAVFDTLPRPTAYLHEAEHLIAGVDRETGDSLLPSSGGDLDGDGYGDLVIRDASEDVGGIYYMGCVFVYPGPVAPGLGYDEAAVRVCGVTDFNSFGITADASGDLDGDGQVDLVAGQYHPSGDAQGMVSVLYGPLADGFTLASDAELTISGEYVSHSAKVGVSGGDWNGDGVDDLVVGAAGDKTNATDAGAVYLFYGQGM